MTKMPRSNLQSPFLRPAASGHASGVLAFVTPCTGKPGVSTINEPRDVDLFTQRFMDPAWRWQDSHLRHQHCAFLRCAFVCFNSFIFFVQLNQSVDYKFATLLIGWNLFPFKAKPISLRNTLANTRLPSHSIWQLQAFWGKQPFRLDRIHVPSRQNQFQWETRSRISDDFCKQMLGSSSACACACVGTIFLWGICAWR